jgi:hypothetical protein
LVFSPPRTSKEFDEDLSAGEEEINRGLFVIAEELRGESGKWQFVIKN